MHYPVACIVNTLRSSYDDCYKRCLCKKCVIALATVINYAPRVINCASRVMLQIVASLFDQHRGRYVFIVQTTG
jgi:hypothetical protein